jgi:8-oxo-dGTP pyrophosphatase MutT (NUDIX family)
MVRGNEVFVYLQKRAKDAKRLPDYFGFFGGGIEGQETTEEALKREIKEELDFVPEGYEFLRSYDLGGRKNAFILEVDSSFEDNIIVLEGEYGKWFSEQEALEEQKLIDEDKVILRDFYKKLKTNTHPRYE